MICRLVSLVYQTFISIFNCFYKKLIHQNFNIIYIIAAAIGLNFYSTLNDQQREFLVPQERAGFSLMQARHSSINSFDNSNHDLEC